MAEPSLDEKQRTMHACEPRNPATATRARRDMSNLAFRIAGLALFVIGAIGLVVPVWPTTIFWILAALAFARSWPAMRDRIYAWPRIGPVIRDFVDRGVLSRKGKRHAVMGMLAGLVIAVLVKPTLVVFVASAGLVGCGAAYVLTRPEPDQHLR